MDRAELKKKIPHGSFAQIAQKAGVNRITVTNYLAGKTDNVAVELAVLELVADYEERRRNLLSRISG